MKSRLDEIKARCAARTPGRWRFRVSASAKLATLMADEPMTPPTRTVLDCVRWGPNGASVRFYDGRGNSPVRLDKLLDEQGEVCHPDAAFIEHAPEDLDWLVAEVERLQRQGEGRLRTVLRLQGFTLRRALARFWRPS